jgi:hypothetical protein
LFENALKAKLKRIFGVEKVSYDRPAPDAMEQQCLFVDIDSSRSRVTHGKAVAKVVGSISLFANSEKVPFGFFNKKLHLANHSDTADLFFYNIDTNDKIIGNIVERRCGFVYLFSGQFDPDAGLINEVDLTFE